jgi:hypothetical protein
MDTPDTKEYDAGFREGADTMGKWQLSGNNWHSTEFPSVAIRQVITSQTQIR